MKSQPYALMGTKNHEIVSIHSGMATVAQQQALLLDRWREVRIVTGTNSSRNSNISRFGQSPRHDRE